MAKTFTLLAALLIVFAIGATSNLTEKPPATTEAPGSTATTKDPGSTATTKDPGSTATTKDPGSTATTKDPGSTATTKDPSSTTTTKDPGSTATTKDPSSTTTTKDPGSTATTKDPGSTATTKDPGSTATTEAPTGSTGSPATTVTGATKPPTTATVPPATTEFPDACASNPCGSGSTCEPRANKTHVCLCLAGDSYNTETSSCQKAKVFPGQLVLTRTFKPSMTDKNSEEFKQISDEIIQQTDKTFKAGTLASLYSNCLVLELRKLPGKRASSASGDKTEASIEYIFKVSTTVTNEKVLEEIKKASQCDGCVLEGSSFNPKTLCDSNPCDAKTTKCTAEDGSFSCSCEKGFIPTSFTDRICLACPSGSQAEDSKCTQCSFGYTGFNCEDSQLLGVVIAASVLGGLLLIAIIVMPIIAVKMNKKGSKKNTYEDIGKPYMSHSVAKTPTANSSVPNGMSSSFRAPAGGVAAPAGVPRIPRATGGSNWDSRTNLEMVPSNSRQNLISSGRNGWINDDQDDTFKFGQSRPQTNQYEHIRPQQSPYGQSSSVNPYAQRQGNSNPYFMSDDDRYSR